MLSETELKCNSTILTKNVTVEMKLCSMFKQHSYPDTANLADRSLEENVVIQKMMEFERLQHIEEDQVWTMSDDQETRSKRP